MSETKRAEKPEPVELDDADLDRIAGGMHIEPVVQFEEIEDGKIDTGRSPDGRG